MSIIQKTIDFHSQMSKLVGLKVNHLCAVIMPFPFLLIVKWWCVVSFLVCVKSRS